MKPASISAIAPALLGFLSMAALGWHLAAPPLTHANAAAGTTMSAPRDHRRTTKSSRDGGIVAQQMRAIRDAASPSERLRTAIALANSLPPSEFAAWMEGDRFDFRKGPELTVFRMIIFERWIKEDPDSLIPWAGRNNYGQAGRALISLAANAPQSLIDHYRNHPDDKAELGILKEVAKNHPALALQRLQELSAAGLSSGTTWATKALLGELAKNSPAALEAVMATLAPDVQREAESALSGQRLATSFSAEVRALWERPDGWRIFLNNVSGNRELASKLIADIAGMPESWKVGMAQQPYYFINEKNGSQWFQTDLEAAGFTASQANDIREQALNRLASSDPEFALKNLDGADIDFHTKANVISSALQSTKGDSAEAEKLINMLNSEADRQLARDQLKLAELATSESKAHKPAEWLEKLGSIDGAVLRPYQVLDQLKSWDKAEFAELRSGFNDLSAEQKQNIARVVAAGVMNTQIDPGFAGDAIRFLVTSSSTSPSASSASSHDNPVMVSSTYAVQLSMSDPAAATSWINTLPEGDAKLWARKNVAANWQQYDPKAVSQWLKTLPTDDQDQITQYLRKQQK